MLLETGHFPPEFIADYPGAARRNFDLALPAPAAMTTGMFPLFTEVGGKGIGLASVQGYQIQHLLQAMDLRLFPFKDALVQLSGQALGGSRLPQASVAMTDTGNLHLQQLLLSQPVQGAYDPVSLRCQGDCGPCRIQGEPDSAFASLAKQGGEEITPFTLKAGENLGRTLQRLEFVVGIEWGSTLQITLQFQIGEQRAQDQGTDVMLGREGVETDIEVIPQAKKFLDQAAQGGLVRGVAIDEIFQHIEIIRADQHLADGGLAVASGTTDLLGVVLQAFGQIVMIDGTDVGLVHPHAEGDGGDYDGVIGRHEPLLHLASQLILQAGVIGARRQPGIGQGPGHAFRRFLQGDIDDAGTRRIAFDRGQQHPVPFRIADRRTDETEVGAVETRAYGAVGRDIEQPADIIQHRWCGGGCQGQDAFCTELTGKAGQFEVVGTEVVPPLRDAVGLIHREQGDIDLIQRCAETFVVEAFRGHVEQTQLAASELSHNLPVLIGTEAGIETAGDDASRGQRIDLILHQSDQR